MALSNPAVKLTEYQKRWLEDKSRFKIANKCRQSGYSFGVALEVVLDCVERKTTWVLLSRGERQSKELMEKVAMHARAIGVVCEELEAVFRIDDQDIKQLEVRFPNGSKVVGLPANPDTARGFSGNVVLDEFAFHADSKKIWQALYPTITRGYKIRVISTPQGKSNKYYQLWTDNSGQWSKHRVDIYEAKAQGMDVDIDELRAGCESEDDWLQEFCCEFIDEAGAFLTYELITPCESDHVSILLPEDFVSQGDLTLGVDIGRKRDLTVMWILEKLGDVYWTRVLHVLEKTPFRIQREHLFNYLSLPRMRRGCIDATGIGAQLAEEAVEAFGPKAEEVVFTDLVKQELAVTMLRTFQDRAARIPADRVVREDLHSVQKHTTAAGNIRYAAERGENGHADRFWSLALSLHAAINAPVGRLEVTTARRREHKAYMGGYDA